MTGVAVASAFPVLAAPSIAAEPIGNDPIFAAIERHKAAFIRHFRAACACGNEPDTGPKVNKEKLARLDREYRESHGEHEAAAWALTTVAPTTAAGVVALVRHVEDFNEGKFGLDDQDGGWRSSPYQWPVDEFDEPGTEAVRFPYDVLTNIGRALAGVTA